MSVRQNLTAELPSCRVDPALKEQVEALAARMERPVSFVQRAALRAYIAKEETK